MDTIKIHKTLMKKMFTKFPDFNWQTSTQESWEKLRWTDSEHEEYKEWAVSYLRKKGFTKLQTIREIGWLILQYAPKSVKNPKT